jgi:transcriptional regulator with GAF, ATPase, and Fis domain
MERNERLLLDVWKETGRHMNPADAVAAIGRLLAAATPWHGLEILRIDASEETLTPVAAWTQRGDGPGHAADAIALDRRRRETLLELLRKNQPLTLSVPAQKRDPVLGALTERYRGYSAGLGPLQGENQRSAGVAVLLAASDAATDAHAELFRRLLEPLAIVLENALRLHELNELRASIEADRRSWLNQLGRDNPVDAIIGGEGGLQPVLIRVDQVARSDSSVLLLGETGSGKEVIARTIHERSHRAEAPFIRVNCGALPPELIDSELFGHEKGSFTGASARRRGWFEQANGGTLFLDEVGELPPAVQVRLLRVLQDGSLYRVGSEDAIHVDVRVIAATHRDLAAMVQQGSFREDLWYRIAVFPILIPPLRERPQDVPELARYFARRASAKIGLHLQLPTADDIALLQAYSWPGNVREMASVIERATILGEGRRLEVAAALGLSAPARPGPGRVQGKQNDRFTTLDQAIIDHICAALTQTRGKVEGRRGAAELLAVNPYTLRSRMRKFGIDPRLFREDAQDE